MKKFVTWVAAVICVLAVALALTSSRLLVPYLHDRTLAKFSAEIEQMPVPAGTTRNGFVRRVGQQTGNGDHCDYLAAVMLATDMNKGDAEAYFKGKYSDPAKLHFLWAEEMENYASRENAVFAIHTLSDWVHGRQPNDKTNLVVYVFEGGFTSSWDYRCR